MFGFVHPQLQIALNLGSPALMKKKEKEKGHRQCNKQGN